MRSQRSSFKHAPFRAWQLSTVIGFSIPVFLSPGAALSGTLSPLPQVQTLASGDSLTLPSNHKVEILHDAALNSTQMDVLDSMLARDLRNGGYMLRLTLFDAAEGLESRNV